MFLEHQMISEESCDTEDWRNDAENSKRLPSQTFCLVVYNICGIAFTKQTFCCCCCCC